MLAASCRRARRRGRRRREGRAADVPWFVFVGPCGGTLVAPDRLLTAAHCVQGRSAAELGQTEVNGELRTITQCRHAPRLASPQRRATSSTTSRSSQLTAPVTSVAPVTLGDGTRAGARSSAPAGHSPRAPATARPRCSSGGLRQATLRQLSDAACAKAFRHNRPGRASASTPHACAARIDVDGREPLSSGCFGDSGGPLRRHATRARALGVVSWGGDRCGADHSPSVFADVARYRAFITSAAPRWMS